MAPVVSLTRSGARWGKNALLNARLAPPRGPSGGFRYAIELTRRLPERDDRGANDRILHRASTQ